MLPSSSCRAETTISSPIGRSSASAWATGMCKKVSECRWTTCLRIVKHVFARVPIGWNRLVAAQQLRIPCIEGGDEERKLGAGVVDVELALHVVARRLQHVGQRIAQNGVARPTVVDGAGGIGADKLDLPALAAPTVDVPECGTRFDDGRHLLLQPRIRQAQVDEARAGDLDLPDRPILRQVLDDRPGRSRGGWHCRRSCARPPPPPWRRWCCSRRVPAASGVESPPAAW